MANYPVDVVAISASPIEVNVTNIVRTRICTWAAPTFGDLGQGVLHKILSAVAFAVAIWSAIEQQRIFKMRYDLAKEYAKIAQEQWNRFNTRYKPLEAMAIAECLNNLPPEPDYPLAQSMGNQMAADGQDLGAMILKKYAKCIDPATLRSYEVSGAVKADDLVNYHYRDQEAYSLVKGLQLFNRRANILKLGRDLAAQSVKFADSANTMLGGIAQGLAQTTNGAMTFLGYIRHREITAYPENLIDNMVSFAQQGAGGFGLFPPTSVDTTG
jgi:hypothetical protein